MSLLPPTQKHPRKLGWLAEVCDGVGRGMDSGKGRGGVEIKFRAPGGIHGGDLPAMDVAA